VGLTQNIPELGTTGNNIGRLHKMKNQIYNPHKTSGCPRCGRDSPISLTYYWGNDKTKKFCCTKCEPLILDAKKRATERTAKWRKQKEDIKAYRAAEAVKYNSKEEVREKRRIRRRRHYANKKAVFREYSKNYRKKHPWVNRLTARRHRALIRQRTPRWADIKKIKEVYRNKPAGMVVDHIMPLRGESVSGLHIHSNLQYLTFEENAKKGNKFETDMRLGPWFVLLHA
jgi:hypothetical protein